jgi:hypothetical protein
MIANFPECTILELAKVDDLIICPGKGHGG